LLKTKTAIENNFNALKFLIATIGLPIKENRIEPSKGKIKYLFYPRSNVDSICTFMDTFKIDQPSINNATLSEYIKAQARNNRITEWSICIVSNTDEKVFINRYENNPDESKRPKDDVKTYELVCDQETVTLGCSVRNQPKNSRGSEYYLISKNQIDDLNDRQVDLSIKTNTTSKDIKEQRASEKKGLMLIYALDERGTNLNFGIPIIGYSVHFPRIEDEIKVSYKASINREFYNEVMEDDDNPETEEN
jgi:hypothetical protein